ncbi:hypothetical protein JOL79_07560 [Microbispora sp. RL4-1S]|uniref:Peptidase inhibitor family I36 protein n=1 Tax=Microbispora oryzae TaxID=2806554 RepID=A0A940WM88_9ACTN|nr:hypothetical protein [Microbispora oryzae]MBP2703656.1 hypothetical protein [Microbispora oryzae]
MSALLASAVAVGAVATPAWADENDGYCTEREVCVFEHWYGGGGRRDYFNADPNFTDDTFWYFSGSWPAPSNAIVNDRTSSVLNGDAYCKPALFQNADYGGNALIIPYGDNDGYMVNDLSPWGMNDTISSIAWRDCL